MSRSVQRESSRAVGTLMHQTNTQSNRKVIMVWPPERRVK